MARLTSVEQSRLYREHYRLVLFSDGYQRWCDKDVAEGLLLLPPGERLYDPSMKTPMRTLRNKMAAEGKEVREP